MTSTNQIFCYKITSESAPGYFCDFEIQTKVYLQILCKEIEGHLLLFYNRLNKMASPSEKAALLDMCRNRVKNYAESKYNFNEYFRGKEAFPEYYKAAVLVPVFVKEGSLRVLLTLRSEQLPTHKGQVAFPGGKQEDCDKDIVDTALREAHEEVGLPPDSVEVVAVLSPLVAKVRDKNMYVYPVIGIIKSQFDLDINTSEVQTTFDVPLEFFLLKDTYSLDTIIFRGREIEVHSFDYTTNDEDQKQTKSSRFFIWGLTATVCLKVAITALNKLPEFKLHERYSELMQYITELNSQESGLKPLSKI